MLKLTESKLQEITKTLIETTTKIDKKKFLMDFDKVSIMTDINLN